MRVLRFAAMTAAAIFLASCSAQPSGMTLETLLERHAEARGGAQALEQLNAVNVKLDIIEPSFTVRGDYHATRDGYMRIDIYADNRRVFTEALGPDGAWQMNAENEVTDVSPDGRAALERGVAGNLYALHELPSHGYALSLAGYDTREETDYWMIEKTAPDGFSETLYLNKETVLIERSAETSALHPDVDSTQARFESLNMDFQETDGVVFAAKTEKRNLDTGELAQTTIVTERRINPEIDPDIFARP